MGFGETVAATAIGVSIPIAASAVVWTARTWALRRWKRNSPAGQGYAYLESKVFEAFSDMAELAKRPPEPPPDLDLPPLNLPPQPPSTENG